MLDFDKYERYNLLMLPLAPVSPNKKIFVINYFIVLFFVYYCDILGLISFKFYEHFKSMKLVCLYFK